MSPVRDSKYRSLPHRRPYHIAVFFTVLHYLCVVAFLSILGVFASRPSEAMLRPVLGMLVLCLATWFVAFLRRRKVRCPLCKGTPLLDSRAVAHPAARRWKPLNYGNTAVLGVLFTHRFRCMYCGTSFDLLKSAGSRR